jgi:deoxyribonuclease-4
MGAGVPAGLARIVRALDRVLAAEPGPRILLEVTAGQGSSLGSTFEELAFVLDRAARPERLGMCFDTCHALAAGYEFRDERSYAAMIDALDHTVGLARVHAFHLNDSKTGLGSKRDRHEAIGGGHVGLAAFGFLLNDRRFRGLPMVIETYKGDDLAEDRVNLAALRSLIAS